MHVSVCVGMCKLYAQLSVQKSCVCSAWHTKSVLVQFPGRQWCREETKGKAQREEAVRLRRVRKEGNGEGGEGIRTPKVPGPLWLKMLVVLSGPRLWAAGGRCRAVSIGYTMLIHLFPFAPAASPGPTRWVLFWTPPPLAGAQDTAAAQKSPGWLWFHPASLHCVPTGVSCALQPEGMSSLPVPGHCVGGGSSMGERS